MTMSILTRSENLARPRRATLSDVAAHAGVSAVTVSRALRHPQMVSPDLRARVQRAVEALGYIPNQLASALASSRTGTIGVLIQSLTNGVFADYLKALHDAFLPAGFQVVVLNSRYSAEEEDKAIATLLGQHPEALILAGIDQSEHARRMLAQSGVPVVQTMELTDDPIDINIGFSQFGAGHAATDHLLALGRRRIGRPVIGAAIGGIPEMIRDGETGLMAASGDAESLAAALSALAARQPAERAAMGRTGRDWIAAEFSAAAYRDRTLALYRTLGAA